MQIITYYANGVNKFSVFILDFDEKIVSNVDMSDYQTIQYDQLIQQGYEIISFTDKRLAAISPRGQYQIFHAVGDRWKLIETEHSFTGGESASRCGSHSVSSRPPFSGVTTMTTEELQKLVDDNYEEIFELLDSAIQAEKEEAVADALADEEKFQQADMMFVARCSGDIFASELRRFWDPEASKWF